MDVVILFWIGIWILSFFIVHWLIKAVFSGFEASWERMVAKDEQQDWVEEQARRVQIIHDAEDLVQSAKSLVEVVQCKDDDGQTIGDEVDIELLTRLEDDMSKYLRLMREMKDERERRSGMDWDTIETDNFEEAEISFRATMQLFNERIQDIKRRLQEEEDDDEVEEHEAADSAS